jgi:hypothetical protein
MRIFILTVLVLGALGSTTATVWAQSLIVIAICTLGDDADPTVSTLQISDEARSLCEEDLTPDNGAFCNAVAAVKAGAGTGMACAEAITNRYLFGFEKTIFTAVASKAPAHVLQSNQTNLEFALQRADASVDLIGCDMLASDGPRATYVQKSGALAGETAYLSCADALQESANGGATLSAGSTTAVTGAAAPGVLHQQGRVIVGSDGDEAKPAEFVIIRIGQKVMTAN